MEYVDIVAILILGVYVGIVQAAMIMSRMSRTLLLAEIASLAPPVVFFVNVGGLFWFVLGWAFPMTFMVWCRYSEKCREGENK